MQYVWQARFNTFAFRIDHEFNQVVTIALYFWYEYLISLYLNTRSEHSQFSSVQFSFSKPKFFVLHRLIFYLLYIHEASCTYSMYTCDCTLYFGRSRENLTFVPSPVFFCHSFSSENYPLYKELLTIQHTWCKMFFGFVHLVLHRRNLQTKEGTLLWICNMWVYKHEACTWSQYQNKRMLGWSLSIFCSLTRSSLVDPAYLVVVTSCVTRGSCSGVNFPRHSCRSIQHTPLDEKRMLEGEGLRWQLCLDGKVGPHQGQLFWCTFQRNSILFTANALRPEFVESPGEETKRRFNHFSFTEPLGIFKMNWVNNPRSDWKRDNPKRLLRISCFLLSPAFQLFLRFLEESYAEKKDGK